MLDYMTSHYIGILTICFISLAFASFLFVYCRFFVPRKMVEKYDSGEIRKKYYVMKKCKVGAETIYYRSGKLNKKKTYENNMLNGPMTVYYESGATYIEATYKNNNLVGEYRVFDEDGQLKHVRNINS